MKIKSAAIRYKGKIFEGPNHSAIGLKMVREGDCPAPYPGGDDQGFVTECGRYDFPNIGLHIYAKLESSVYWGGSNWFERQWKRIKYSAALLFRGWIEVEQEFLFMNDEHITNFIKALEEGREKILKLSTTDQG